MMAWWPCWIAGLGLAGCAPDTRSFDCAAIAAAYAGCPAHVGIRLQTDACAFIHDRQGIAPLTDTIDRAAAICERAGSDCDLLFVCLSDPDGLSALTAAAHVTGTATISGVLFTFDAMPAWAWIGTSGKGAPGDFGVLFEDEGNPWFFKLEDFAARAKTKPFVVDGLRPVKLENAADNVEIASGTVEVIAFALGGAFDVTVAASNTAGDVLDLHFQGSFARGDNGL